MHASNKRVQSPSHQTPLAQMHMHDPASNARERSLSPLLCSLSDSTRTRHAPYSTGRGMRLIPLESFPRRMRHASPSRMLMLRVHSPPPSPRLSYTQSPADCKPCCWFPTNHPARPNSNPFTEQVYRQGRREKERTRKKRGGGKGPTRDRKEGDMKEGERQEGRRDTGRKERGGGRD